MIKRKRNYNTVFITIIALVLIALIILLAYFIHYEEPKLALSEIIKIVIEGLTIVLIFYAVLSYVDMQKKNEGDARQQKVTATFQVLTEWYKDPLNEYGGICNSFECKQEFTLLKTDPEQFMEFIDSN